MITHINGDLLSSNVDAIGHCANCFCTMGSGIARQIKLQLPEAYAEDLKGVSGDRNKFGKFSVAEIKKPQIKTNIKYVYNLYGQYNYGTDSRKLNYESIYTALTGMKNHAITKDIKTVGFPENMGCMLAGGSWNIVYAMIKDVFDPSPFDVIICKYTK
jgi:O-acetyl-ADP-ribose deacetylase (regulator of RNase III)